MQSLKNDIFINLKKTIEHFKIFVLYSVFSSKVIIGKHINITNACQIYCKQKNQVYNCHRNITIHIQHIHIINIFTNYSRTYSTKSTNIRTFSSHICLIGKSNQCGLVLRTLMVRAKYV